MIIRLPFMSCDGRRNHRSNWSNFNVAAQAEDRNLRRRHALSRRHRSIGSFVASCCLQSALEPYSNHNSWLSYPHHFNSYLVVVFALFVPLSFVYVGGSMLTCSASCDLRGKVGRDSASEFVLVTFSRFYRASLSSRCAAQNLYACAKIGSAALAVCSELDFLESLFFPQSKQHTTHGRMITRLPFMSCKGRRNHRSNRKTFNVTPRAGERNLRHRQALSRRHRVSLCDHGEFQCWKV